MAKKTYYNPSASQLEANWRVIDAKGKVLGRLATGIARTLTGKEKPGYVPHMISGDFVIVINSRHIKLTGNKSTQKKYVRHSGRPGGKKEVPFEVMLERHPERVVRAAVKGMLPKNKLGDRMLKRLSIYPDAEHPHEAQIRGQAIAAAKSENAKTTPKQEKGTSEDELPAENETAIPENGTEEKTAHTSSDDKTNGQEE